jgi:MFS family permease
MVQAEVASGAGVASSYYSSATMTASLVAGAVAGVSAAAIGYRGVFWVCAGLSTLAVVLLLARAWRYGTWRRAQPGGPSAPPTAMRPEVVKSER